jgi:hypothetical protein
MKKRLQWIRSKILKATKTICHERKRHVEITYETAFLNNQRIMRRGQEMILNQNLISVFR